MAATSEADAERWRVFLAIDVPEAVRRNLEAPLEALHPISDCLRLNSVERMHLTLHFLGHLPVADVDHLQQQLPPVVALHQRLRLVAQGVGAFPNIGRAQVLWAGIVGAELPKLVVLQSDLGKTLEAAGVAIEGRFHPHLTLARVRRPLRGPTRKLLQDWYASWREAPFGKLSVESVRFMRSQLGAGPAPYTTLATFALK